jgi:hypothetical protein
MTEIEMSVKIDLYDNAYANEGTDLYQRIPPQALPVLGRWVKAHV